ncbi:FdtA/QdtA family cupin domain-containing protein [Flavobacterium sp. Fl-77]|uniref:FdtA/QdtA family cupin domain-containing protein n=1 Tax=Flavobacterium flavipigmentatum TaxID=2893884 RepID=A0AAJ2W0F7_9FLAO|nr:MULTISPECIES: FdtA/QdtA family cupin domain-containing protein [unclassified Flavobacterium]MDX6181901.1 FdtA/QdtA family cupin domain-containing protein [Flavobacterium sp. Fl-33]MDX6185065.1 FdtA/QdtA family cupin domain-containing protein [Flavobacterium sp. Fl-77]UFH37175.1 FdtA/QdtA family cupin domain-containing protein [Flavobacterium sp. F-70]
MNIDLINFPKVENILGNIAVIENATIPFEIKRVYYLYDIPSSSKRGGHSHKKLQQILIAISGSFDVVLKDGETVSTITLNKPDKGLLIKNNIWRELENFSSGAVCLVLASEVFDEEDYIRDYSEFLEFKK